MSSDKSNELESDKRRMSRPLSGLQPETPSESDSKKTSSLKKFFKGLYYLFAIDSFIKSFRFLAKSFGSSWKLIGLAKQSISELNQPLTSQARAATPQERYEFLTKKNRAGLRIDDQHYLNFGICLIVTILLTVVYFKSNMTMLLSQITYFAVWMLFALLTIGSYFVATKTEKEIIDYESNSKT